MAGHSKWANIKHRNGAQDAKRGKLFTKLIREITVAARTGGGGDPAHNPRLRAVMDKALTANMTKDTIERAIKRGTGELEGAQYEDVHYEGYGPGGAAVMIEGTTDNRTRTVAEVRYLFDRCGGNLGQDGSVAYLFRKLGVLTYPPGSDADAVFAAALEGGADDVVTDDDGSIEVLCAPEAFAAVRAALEGAGLAPEHAEVTQRAENDVSLVGDNAERMLKLLEGLEDLDDVQNVYTNADLPSDLAVAHA